MIDPITNTNENNSFSTDSAFAEELDEVNHVRFHPTFKINYIRMKWIIIASYQRAIYHG